MSKKAAKPPQPESSRTDAAANEWPNTIRTREELDNALDAGSESGVSDRTVADVLKEVLVRRKNAGL